MAANHLDLRNALLEFGTEGSLSIFSDGKSIVLSTREIEQVVSWLSQEQKEKRLDVGSIRMVLDTRGGLNIRKERASFFISANDIGRTLNWLKQHRAS